MSTTPRNLPRFVPTLTEVVAPSSLTGTAPSTRPDTAQIVQSVMQRVEPVLEARVRDGADAMLRRLVMEHLQTMHLRLREELVLVVQQAVAEAIAQREDRH